MEERPLQDHHFPHTVRNAAFAHPNSFFYFNDCKDAGGRATQEQLPRPDPTALVSGWMQRVTSLSGL